MAILGQLLPLLSNSTIAGTLFVGSPDASTIGLLLYPQSSAEFNVGVTPKFIQYPYGDIRRYGAMSSGGDCTSAITNAASCNNSIVFPSGAWQISSTPSIPVNVILQVLPGASFSGPGANALGIQANAFQQIIEENSATTDFATSYIRRQANHTGGTPGRVEAGLRVDAVVNSGVTNYEWGFLSVLTNNATAGQNVAGYFQGNKQASAGPTWAAVHEAHDRSGSSNPTSGLIGLEVDVFADGTDSNSTRIGIDIVGGVGVSVGPTITYGLRIGPQSGSSTNCNFTNGIYIYGVVNSGISIATSGSSVVGITTANATLSGAAYRMASGQFIGFDSSDVHTLRYDSTGLVYRVSGTLQARLRDTGAIDLNAGVTTISGTFSSGAATPVLTANKPGSGTAIGTWLSVVVNGSQYWIPAWAN